MQGNTCCLWWSNLHCQLQNNYHTVIVCGGFLWCTVCILHTWSMLALMLWSFVCPQEAPEPVSLWEPFVLRNLIMLLCSSKNYVQSCCSAYCLAWMIKSEPWSFRRVDDHLGMRIWWCNWLWHSSVYALTALVSSHMRMNYWKWFKRGWSLLLKKQCMPINGGWSGIIVFFLHR